jgi:transcriptional regulator with XRE-family HTH domain
MYEENIKQQAADAIKAAKEAGITSYRLCKEAGVSPQQLKAVEEMKGYNIDTLIAISEALKRIEL